MMDLRRGLLELDETTPDFEKAHSYYRGNVEEYFGSLRMRRVLKESGGGVRFNFAKRPVDAVADRLEIAGITTTTVALNDTIQEVWESNSLDLEAGAIMRRACEYGDAYVIVWPRDPEGQDVAMYYNSPVTTRIVYDDENPLVKLFAIKRWVEMLPTLGSIDERHRVDLYYPDRIEKYISRAGTAGEDETAFEIFTDNEGDEWPYDNPFGEIPVFHFRTDRPYGIPLHEGFYGPQDAINKLVVSHLSSVDFQSFPQRYALLEAGTDTDDSADEVDFPVDDDEDTVRSGEGDSQFTASPGSLWNMRGVKGVGQFDVADPAVFIEPMLTYLRMGAELTNTPLHRVDPTGDHPSGESLRTAEAPFIKTVRSMQRLFGSTWREVFEFALHVVGVDNQPVTVQWAPAQTMEDKDFWEVAEKKVALGVPLDQILIEAGYTQDQVTAWLGTGNN